MCYGIKPLFVDFRSDIIMRVILPLFSRACEFISTRFKNGMKGVPNMIIIASHVIIQISAFDESKFIVYFFSGLAFVSPHPFIPTLFTRNN